MLPSDDLMMVGLSVLFVAGFVLWVLANTRVLSAHTRKLYLWEWRDPALRDNVYHWGLLFVAVLCAEKLPEAYRSPVIGLIALAAVFGGVLMLLFPDRNRAARG